MEPVLKMSEIRAKFPMYSDLNDEQLLMGVRQKFYADIPPNKFYSKIDFDTERARLDPTNDMGTGARLLAGAGKGLTDVARGVGQAFGLVSRDDVAESRRLDQALVNTGAGKVGNVAGAVAATLPAAFIPGANTLAGAGLIGAGTGLLAPSTSTQETLTNTGMGAALGPASLLAGRAIGAGYEGLKGLVQPLTKRGQEQVAASTLQSFAQNPARAAEAMRSAKPIVPNSMPTMAQASGDPGLAQLERTLLNNPETGPNLAARFADQRAARLAAVKEIAGTDEYYNAIRQGREVFAQEDYGRALTESFDKEMAKALQPQIKALMERPSIQQAKGEALSLAKETGVAVKNWGSVEGLDWLKKGLDNLISKAKSPGNSIGDAKLRALVQTKQDLMSVIEEVAPAYKAANDNFAAMSKQVNSMDVARDLLKRYEPALARYGANTRETANAYATALEGAVESTKKSTGMDMPLAKLMPSRDVAMLEGVAKDMARKAKAEDLGRGVGSNTAQNLAAQNLLRRVLGPTGLPQSWSESSMLQTALAPATGLYRLGGAEQRVMDQLSDAALDPQRAAALMLLAKTRDPLERLGIASERFLPVLPMAGLFAQPQQ